MQGVITTIYSNKEIQEILKKSISSSKFWVTEEIIDNNIKIKSSSLIIFVGSEENNLPVVENLDNFNCIFMAPENIISPYHPNRLLWHDASLAVPLNSYKNFS